LARKAPIIEIGDSPYRKEEELLDIVPFDLSKGYDMHKIIALIADGGIFVESKDVFAPSVITGFARIGGQSVGIVASNPAVNSELWIWILLINKHGLSDFVMLLIFRWYFWPTPSDFA
jgi:acetyl-CoA carboxylase carboxyltransferase component